MMRPSRFVVVTLLLASACTEPPAAPRPKVVVPPDSVTRRFCILSVRMDPINTVLVPGDSTRLEVRAGCGELTAGFTWTSSNAAVAVVELRENLPGRSVSVVRALSPGQAVITARSVDDSAIDGTAAITVQMP